MAPDEYSPARDEGRRIARALASSVLTALSLSLSPSSPSSLHLSAAFIYNTSVCARVFPPLKLWTSAHGRAEITNANGVRNGRSKNFPARHRDDYTDARARQGEMHFRVASRSFVLFHGCGKMNGDVYHAILESFLAATLFSLPFVRRRSVDTCSFFFLSLFGWFVGAAAVAAGYAGEYAVIYK